MWVRTFGWRLQAHDRQQFPVGSSVALGRGGGVQASGVRGRRRGRLFQAETQGQQEIKREKQGHTFPSGVAETATTPVPAPPPAHLKLT